MLRAKSPPQAAPPRPDVKSNTAVAQRSSGLLPGRATSSDNKGSNDPCDENTSTDEMPDALKRIKMMVKQLGAPKGGKGGKPSGLAPVRTKLYSRFVASQASTALASALTIDIGNMSEVKNSWSALYDEVKLHGGEVAFSVAMKGAGQLAKGVVCYDPADFATLGSVVEGAEHSQKLLLGLDGDVNSHPTPIAKNGMFHFRFSLRGVAPAVESASRNYPGVWHGLNATNSDLDGAVKFYFENLAGSGNTVIDGFLILDVTFRSRT